MATPSNMHGVAREIEARRVGVYRLSDEERRPSIPHVELRLRPMTELQCLEALRPSMKLRYRAQALNDIEDDRFVVTVDHRHASCTVERLATSSMRTERSGTRDSKANPDEGQQLMSWSQLLLRPNSPSCARIDALASANA